MRVGRWLTLAAAAVLLASQVSFMLVILNVLNFGSIGVGLGKCDPQRFCEIIRVRPDTPAQAAGLVVGQGLRIDDPIQAARSRAAALMPGEQVALTIRDDAGERPLTVKAKARNWTGGNQGLQAVDLQLTLVAIVAVLLGVFLALRSHGRPSVLLLGAGAILSCAWGTPLPYWLNTQPLFPWSIILTDLLIALAPVLFLAFAIQYRRETTDRGRALVLWTLGLYGAARLVLLCLIKAATFTDHRAQVDRLAGLDNGLAHLALLLTLIVMIAGRREAGPEQRDRFGVIIPATILFMAYPNMGILVELSPQRWTPSNPVVILTMILPLAGLIGLVYAVLRHRIVDLGFVINRTLIYGVLSTVLLLAFWFAEWGLEEMIPNEGRWANMLVSAGIAFAIFLFFERARDWVKQAVEHLFFRTWRESEAKLRRFVRDAAFITREEALLSATLAELSRFASGARVALFQVEDGEYVLKAGDPLGAGARLDPDQPALVRLRADRTLQESDLPGEAELMAPIILRSEIAGFFLFGAKPTGEQYRPDEQAVLAEAAQALGQHLQALAIETQARALAQLEQQNGQLRLALSLVGASPQPAG